MNLKELIDWNKERAEECNRCAADARSEANDKRSSKFTREIKTLRAETLAKMAQRHTETVDALSYLHFLRTGTHYG